MKHIGSYEAKTHLPSLLDSVERGETIVITRRGRPAARLVPISASLPDVRAAITGMAAFGTRHRGRLKGISSRDLIEDGRRF